MGGKGVKPVSAAEHLGAGRLRRQRTRAIYMQDHGAGAVPPQPLQFLKRTAPPPFMANFDAPNREQFCTRRERSNTPLQALQLMNDVQHFEAARGARRADDGRRRRDAGGADRVRATARCSRAARRRGAARSSTQRSSSTWRSYQRRRRSARSRRSRNGESKPEGESARRGARGLDAGGEPDPEPGRNR